MVGLVGVEPELEELVELVEVGELELDELVCVELVVLEVGLVVESVGSDVELLGEEEGVEEEEEVVVSSVGGSVGAGVVVCGVDDGSVVVSPPPPPPPVLLPPPSEYQAEQSQQLTDTRCVRLASRSSIFWMLLSGSKN